MAETIMYKCREVLLSGADHADPPGLHPSNQSMTSLNESHLIHLSFQPPSPITHTAYLTHREINTSKTAGRIRFCLVFFNKHFRSINQPSLISNQLHWVMRSWLLRCLDDFLWTAGPHLVREYTLCTHTHTHT